MQKYFWQIVVFFLIFGCFDVAKRPEILLGKEQMSEVFYLIYINKNYSIVEGSSIRATDYDLKIKTLNELNISERIFDQSLDYYALHPEQNKEILEIVKSRLEEEKIKLEKGSKAIP